MFMGLGKFMLGSGKSVYLAFVILHKFSNGVVA